MSLFIFAEHLLTSLVVSKEADDTRLGSWQILLVPLHFHKSSVTVSRCQRLLLFNMDLFNASIIVQKRLQRQIRNLPELFLLSKVLELLAPILTSLRLG